MTSASPKPTNSMAGVIGEQHYDLSEMVDERSARNKNSNSLMEANGQRYATFGRQSMSVLSQAIPSNLAGYQRLAENEAGYGG